MATPPTEPEIEASKFAPVIGLIFALLVLGGLGIATAVSAGNDGGDTADHGEETDDHSEETDPGHDTGAEDETGHDPVEADEHEG